MLNCFNTMNIYSFTKLHRCGHRLPHYAEKKGFIRQPDFPTSQLPNSNGQPCSLLETRQPAISLMAERDCLEPLGARTLSFLGSFRNAAASASLISLSSSCKFAFDATRCSLLLAGSIATYYASKILLCFSPSSAKPSCFNICAASFNNSRQDGSAFASCTSEERARRPLSENA